MSTSNNGWRFYQLNVAQAVVFIALGALLATASGIWWTIATQRDIVAEQRDLRGDEAALAKQVADLGRRIDTLADSERDEAQFAGGIRRELEAADAIIRERIARLEAVQAPFVAAATSLVEVDKHTHALDGRADASDRALDSIRKDIAAMKAILAASGRKR